MIRHMVLFRVAEGTPREQLQDAIDRLEGLVGVVPGLTSLDAGIEIGIEGNFDFGLVAELTDRAALDVFATHEAHTEIAADIAEFRTDIAILDLEI